MKLRIDMHVHTMLSKDGHIPLGKLPKIITIKNLQGIAITDHDSAIYKRLDISSFDEAGILIIPGIEVTTSQGHLVGLWVYDDVPRRVPPEEAADEIHRQGGLVVAPHPYDLSSKWVNPFSLKDRIDAIETINASSFPFWLSSRLAERAAERLNLPRLGGSDAHIPETVGDAYTEVEASNPSIDEVFKAIKRGATSPHGHSTSLRNRFKKGSLSLFK